MAKNIIFFGHHWATSSLLLLLALNLCGQENVYIFNHLTAEEGLTSGQYNYYVHQDQEGLVWISSVMGLNRFDGRHIKQYHSDPNNPRALQHEFASQSRFQEAQNGDLWFTNNICLIRYDRENDQFYNYQFKKPNGDTARTRYFWAYLNPETGDLFTSGDQHLFFLNIHNPKEQLYIDSIYVNLKDRMVPASQGGYLLFICGYGSSTLQIRHYKNHRLHSAPTNFPAPDGAGINDINYESDTLIWIGSTKGLYRFNLLTGEWIKISSAYQEKKISNVVEIARRKNGQLIVATQSQGIFFFDPILDQYIGQIKAFQNDRITLFQPLVERMTLDNKENLWIYAKDDGLYYTYLDNPKFELVMAGLGNGVYSFKALAEGKNGEIWALLTKGVLKISSRDTLYFPLPITGIDLEQTTSIFEDRQGRVWVGTLKELFVLQPGHTGFSAIDLLPPNSPRKQPGYNSFMELPNGQLLIATNALHLLLVDADLSTSRWFTQSLSRPRYLFKGKKEHFIIHTYQDSLFIGNLRTDLTFAIDTVFHSIPFVSEIRKDPKQDFYWISTFNGLFRLYYSGNKWHFQKEPDLNPNITINSLLPAADGKLWMSINTGLMTYDPNNHELFVFNKADGLQGIDFNIGAALQHSDGRFFFGGTDGLNVFRPEKIRNTVPLVRPAIIGIKINQKDSLTNQYAPSGARNPMHIEYLILPHAKNNLSLAIAPLEYSDPQSCKFRYQLLGSTDTSQVEHGNTQQIDLLNLAPGHYTLNIWASNSDGVWSEKPRSLKIDILPPWYRTWWFFLLILLLLACVFYAFYRYRLREALHKQSLKQAAMEARQLAAETETAVLRLQMNPHFIFNSLNSIDAYILGGDKLKAHDYLIRFADLMRGILNNSEKAMNSLDDEIELLQQYLGTEQLRIGPRLSFSFDISPEVDTYETEIPTMILQPFVENAIWHGISPKVGPGHIRIGFRLETGALVCEVQDDGVGRKSPGATKKHDSKALTITERRLALLRPSKSGRKSHYEIIDEMDEKGWPSGTTVCLYFPIS